MHTPAKLLLENRAWSEEISRKDPDFFAQLAKEQKPDFLWIGCSDSRVPADTIVNARPGEIFVHRNIANQVIVTDFNCLSVVQYAVNVLKVKHVIVCGHYGCGGVKAALQQQKSDLVIANKWLMHIKDVYRLHQEELESVSPEQKVDRLIELNIVEQVYRLAYTSIIQSAWRHGHKPSLHGWVYGLNDGLIQELIKLDHNTQINPIYRYAD
ncbi:carbonate dehydratase [Methylomonas koyamae]|uniref:Carbonic anhydrase n=1 Tax=Methylomonas koyamae TaxID=702114 RepID=A0A177NCR2_9GAMM|nr:carbonate dehydratase [Methylomonas koyamae]ATG88744.1 carbonate dehydratase [Methylomonas koyamae]OAI15827.1 carbonic anhydrase [Methylomonas koyamae]WNB76399.1 carbonate dehydratase [Methylomonas koyamae]BBL56806.1 carbonic anhydrase [Methylomonas koyamae]